jgi:hypothetical protein
VARPSNRVAGPRSDHSWFLSPPLRFPFKLIGQEDAMSLAITYDGETFEEVAEQRSAAPQTAQPAANALQIGGAHVGAL